MILNTIIIQHDQILIRIKILTLSVLQQLVMFVRLLSVKNKRQAINTNWEEENPESQS